MATLYDARWSVREVFQKRGVKSSPFYYGRILDTRTGQVHEFSTKESNKLKAKAAVGAFLRELKARSEQLPVATSAGFAAAFKEYLDLKEPEVRAAYIESLRLDADLYSRAFGENFLVGDILPADIEHFLCGLAKAKRSARTRKKHLTALRGFFAWARRRRLCESDPTDGLRVGKGTVRKGRALSLEEARKLLVASRTSVVHAITGSNGKTWDLPARRAEWLPLAILLGLHAGLRRSTIRQLRWKNVDLANRRLEIPGEIMKKGLAVTLPIHPELQAALEAAIREGGKVPSTEFVVGAGGKLNGATLEAAARRAGLLEDGKRLGWHDLRRTFGTWYSLRVTHAVLKRLLGHGATDVTDLYAIVPFETLQAAVDATPWISDRGGNSVDSIQTA